MSFLNIENPKDIQLLAMNSLPLERYEKIRSVISRANANYSQLSDTHSLFSRLLALKDCELGKDPDFKFMQADEKQEWLKVRNTKAGDLSFLNHYLAEEIAKEMPPVFVELVEPVIAENSDNELAGELVISDDIDALLLSASIPAYFRYLEQMTTYKKGLFSKLRRGFISYMQIRAINVVCHFMKAFESDLVAMDQALLNEAQLTDLPKMGEIVSELCDRADPHHHDPISLYAINCLRSMYISVFNISINLLRAGREIPLNLRRFLPIIPDKISFSKDNLVEDQAWERYQDHLFLFQDLPGDDRAELEEMMCQMLPAQKISLIGCLGKAEIQELLMPILDRGSHFEKLAFDCQNIPKTDTEHFPEVNRLIDVLCEFYVKILRKRKTVSKKLHQLFVKDYKAGKRGKSKQLTLKEKVDLTRLCDYSFMVVDDSERIRKLTIKVLRQVGIKRILEAADGLSAWEILQKKAVDIVLCDWIMPGLTGIELIRKIMDRPKLASRITFIMLTTVNSKSSIVEALSSGVRGYLIKPFTRKQLLEKVYFATEWLRKEQLGG